MTILLRILAFIAVAVFIKSLAESNNETSQNQRKEQPHKNDFRYNNSNHKWDWWEHLVQEKNADAEEISYKDCYQAKYLFTKNELYEYKKLKEYARAKNLTIFPKVRLLDIVTPRESKSNRKVLLWKIQSKHVDFVICNESMHIKAILELDDNSHNMPKRKDRDRFVDEVLTDCGYKVIHTRSITESTLNGL